MAGNLFIQLIARLNKALSKAQIQTDIKEIEKTPFYVRMTGRLNRSLTRRNIENDAQNIARNINVDINARVSERELQNSFDTARQNLENNIQNNPINVPVNIDTEGMQQGQQQMNNLNNEARNARGIFSDYLSAREIFRAVTSAIREAVEEVKALNKAQTDLQIATSKSASEMKSLMQDYNQLAKDMSSTTLDISETADSFLRQGHSVADTNTLIKDSLILAKVGQLESEEATKYLTSAMKGYQVEAENVLGIVDKLSATDMAAAVSAGGLAESMSKCANSASTAGVSMDSLIGYIATVAEVTQKSDSVVGESFKTIMARMGKIKLNDWIDDDGTDISGEINDVEKTLGKFDIALRKSATEFRDFEDVIYDVGMAWDKFSSVDKNAIANAFGGVYQRENVLTLFNNFSRALELTEVSANSAGTAMEKFSIYENSLEAATNRLTASLEGLAYNTVNADFLKGLINATAGIVEFVDSTKLIQTGLTAAMFTGAISGLVALGTRMVALRNNVTQFTQAMEISRSTTALTASQYNNLRLLVSGLTESQLRLVLSSRQLTEAQRLELMQIAGIEQARQRQLLQTWHLTDAENAQTVATFSLRGAWEGLKASIVANPIGLIVTALTLATTAITTYKQKQEEARQEAVDSANAINDQSNSMKDLVSQYEKILDSEKTESEKTEELNKWKQTLAETYGFEKDKLAELNTEREKGIELLNAEIDAENSKKRGEWLAEYANQFEKAKSLIENPEWDGGTDGTVQSSFFAKIDSKNIRDSIAEQFTVDDVAGTFDFSGDNLIETYENLKNILSIMGNAKDLSYDEKNLLDKLNKEEASIKKVLDEYLSIYETGYDYKALNSFADYKQNNPLADVGKESYISWRDGLLATAEGDKALEKELLALAEQQFPDYAKYFENLNKAKIQFGATKPNSGFDALKKNFLESLSDEDLEVAIQIPDLFIDGIENATEKIENFKKVNNFDKSIKSLEELKEAYDGISDSADKFISSQKTLNSAFEEQEKYGQLASSTVSNLIEAGYSRALSVDAETGAITLNKDAVEMLNNVKKQELKLSIMREKLSLQEKLRDESVEINSLTAEMAHATEERREEIRTLIAERMAQASLNDEAVDLIKQYDAILSMIDNPIEFDSDSNKSTKDEEPAQVTAFKKELAEKQHLVAMKKLSEEEYLNWLDGAYKEAYAGLTGYEDELYKYEEEIFSKRRELAEKAFDDTIDGIEKEIDTLDKLKDNASLDSNVSGNIYEIIDQQIGLYNNAIATIDKRIAELEASGLVGIEDEIEELNKQKDDLLDKVYNLSKDRTSIGVDNEIKYWEEMQSKQNEFYDKQIEKLKKQKELLEDKNDEEERAKDLAEKQLELRKAQIALEDARRNRNVLVYYAGGAYSYEADQTAIAEAEEDVKKAKEDLEELRQEEIKDNLDKQIDILEEQKDKDSEYYDTIIKLLEDMSGDNKVQSESNRSIWGELLATEAGQKAIAQIDPDKLQELLDSGFLVKKDGKYSLGEQKPSGIFHPETDVVKILSKILHKSESEILSNQKLMNAVSNDFSGFNSLAMPSQSTLSELTKVNTANITNYNNNSKVSNTYHVDKIDVGYSGDDFNDMLGQAFTALNQAIVVKGNKVAYGN